MGATLTMACATSPSVADPEPSGEEDSGTSVRSEASVQKDGGERGDGGARSPACGQLLPGAYDFTMEYVSGAGCSTMGQTGTANFTSFPKDLQEIGDALGGCTRVDAPDGCPATISCSGGNGRLAQTATYTFSIPTSGPVSQFSYTSRNTSHDTLGAYPDTDCTWRTTYVAKK